jgi:RNA polymerase sigma factor (sigma-70 family)
MQDSSTIPPPESLAVRLDVELLEAWVKHQREEDFTEIVRRHLGLVQGIARRQLDQDQAEDIAQRVFAVLARKASSLTDLRSLSAWLHRVTLLQCHSAVRSRMRDRRNQEAAMEDFRITNARDPLAEALPHLDAAIGDLSEIDRELILIRYSEGLTFSEAARRTGRKEAALRQQAGRALEKLSGMLRRRGVSVPVTTLTVGLGVHLAGNSTASAAMLVSSFALSSAGGISGFTLAGITLLTMTTKQSLIAGASLAALLITGPLAWRATQIHQAAQSLAAFSQQQISPESAAVATGPRKTRVTPDRSNQPMSEADQKRMFKAIPGILKTKLDETLIEWFERDAWMEARRTASALGLSEVMEVELWKFLAAEHTRQIKESSLDNKNIDYTARHKNEKLKLDAWFATRLTPEQEEGRKRMNEEKDRAIAQRIAAAAVQGIRSDLGLTEEQKSLLLEAATAKVSRSLEEKTYPSSMGYGFKIVKSGLQFPVEERSEEFVRSVLDPGQMEIWAATLLRDREFGDNLQRRVIGGFLEQLKKAKPTPEQLREPFNK